MPRLSKKVVAGAVAAVLVAVAGVLQQCPDDAAEVAPVDASDAGAPSE